MENVSSKKRSIALVLSILLGYFGVHRFYVGKIGTGILMIVVFIIIIFAAPVIFGLMTLLGFAQAFSGDSAGAGNAVAGMSGIVMIIPALFIWPLIDMLIIVFGAFKDKEGKKVASW